MNWHPSKVHCQDDTHHISIGTGIEPSRPLNDALYGHDQSIFANNSELGLMQAELDTMENAIGGEIELAVTPNHDRLGPNHSKPQEEQNFSIHAVGDQSFDLDERDKRSIDIAYLPNKRRRKNCMDDQVKTLSTSQNGSFH